MNCATAPGSDSKGVAVARSWAVSAHFDFRSMTRLPVFARLAASHRFHVVPDQGGWPTILGKLGRLERHDGAQLAVYTAHPRLFARLWAIPGVRPWQLGDQEAGV